MIEAVKIFNNTIPDPHLRGHVLVLRGLRRTLGQDLLHLTLGSLGVVRLHLQPITVQYYHQPANDRAVSDLLHHGDAVLCPPDLVVELGVVQRQGDEGGELGDQLHILLGRYVDRMSR